MSDELSKKHHYIPEGVLKNFCASGRSTFYYNKETPEKGVKPRNIGKIFFKRHSNSFQMLSEKRNDSFERTLANGIDNRIAPLIERMTSGDFVSFSDSDKRTIVEFLISRGLRSPFVREFIFDDLNIEVVLRKKMQEHGINVAFIGERWGSDGAPVSLSEYLFAGLAAGLPEEAVTELMACSFVCCVPSGDKSFVVGDVPFLRLTNYYEHLDVERFELWCVLAPNLAISLLERPDFSVPEQFDVSMSDEAVDLINTRTAQQSQRIASIDKRLLEELVSSL